MICELKRPGDSYADLAPVPGAVEKIRALREAGHRIIIHTARHMLTCRGNVALCVARIGPITLDWLQSNGIEFDEIHFGKPYAHIYLDDNAERFRGWSEIAADGSNLPEHAERRSKDEQ